MKSIAITLIFTIAIINSHAQQGMNISSSGSSELSSFHTANLSLIIDP